MTKVKSISKQINELKKVCRKSEFQYKAVIYKILICKEFKDLLSKKAIPNSVVNENGVNISFEEKFIENLNNYLTCVKAHFGSMADDEFLCIIKLSLDNKYVSVLYSTLDFNDFKNHEFFFGNFVRLFLYNLYDNLMFYASLEIDEPYILSFINEIKDLNFDNETDLLTMEEFFDDILLVRKNNLHQIFKPYKKLDEKEKNIQIRQLECILSEYHTQFTEKISDRSQKAKIKKQQLKESIVVFTIVFTLIIILLIVLFLAEKNKNFRYSLNGESDNFSYRNLLFYRSGNSYNISYGDATVKNPDIKDNDIISVALKCDEYLIYRSSSFMNGLHSEKIGYDEMFPKNVVDNIDNWTIEIVYSLEDDEVTETIYLDKSNFK